jgi:hypothetical protein
MAIYHTLAVLFQIYFFIFCNMDRLRVFQIFSFLFTNSSNLRPPLSTISSQPFLQHFA